MFKLCFHEWTVWSDPIVSFTGRKQQWRCCTKCNKANFRSLRWDNQSDIKQVIEKLNAVRENENSKI